LSSATRISRWRGRAFYNLGIFVFAHASTNVYTVCKSGKNQKNMKKPKKLKKLPTLRTDKEAEDFVDNADLSEYDLYPS
jgi:hypothetical protein